jgi:hypothetical protein
VVWLVSLPRTPVSPPSCCQRVAISGREIVKPETAVAASSGMSPGPPHTTAWGVAVRRYQAPATGRKMATSVEPLPS